ncbi:MAG: SatD family protein [Candidatus Acidiferrum sp.]
MPSTIYGVLIADVLESRARTDIRGLLGRKLAAVSKRHLRKKLIQLPYSVTAGDEFQTVTRDLASIPAVILDLRRALRPLSLRIGVGFGRISDRIQPPVNRLGGEAFQRARGAIENIKTSSLFKFDVLTAFESRNAGFNSTINLIYGLHDTLVLKITDKQWETIEEFLDTPTLEQTAKRLRLDASTVSRNLKRGYYWQLSETVKVAGSLIERTFC